MIAIDTNILLRYVMKDDSAQARKAAGIIDSCDEDNPAFINAIVLAEFVWVLEKGYRYSKKDICEALERLLNCVEMAFEHTDAALYALRHFREGKVGFSDLLLGRINKLHGCKITKTFDRGAGTKDDFETV